MLTFNTDPTGKPLTDSGQDITCDGCGTTLTTTPTTDQVVPVPAPVARTVYEAAPGTLHYIVCDRGIDCLTLALLADELWQRCRCRTAGCTGDICTTP